MVTNDNDTARHHGSLTRAGKVRAQTPKVEPSPKKYRPCGRARKRAACMCYIA